MGSRVLPQESQRQGMRTSVVLDPPLRENLKCVAQRNGQPQGQIIREALRYYLKEKQGLEPDKFPKLKMEISY